MDDSTFHKSRRTQELIESVGCKMLFLPPYSPDLNPIEKFWANMKRWIRNQIARFTSLEHILDGFFPTC
ncbi:transposase [Candidatus Lariskella endosymbiont of Hedychridium roseum]|uniref:transposase n=1 Tax=Candidatus Lariskella endosymbiont of Hedychridium roseum TaxID=3077949 RepID=UPI003977289D